MSVLKSFIIGDGSSSYQHTRNVAQLAVMKAMGANAVVINPYFRLPGTTGTATTIVGKYPFGLDFKLELYYTHYSAFGTTTATPTNVSAVKTTTPVTTFAVTGRTIKSTSGANVTGVKVFCDQYLRQLAVAARNAGLTLWLKPMLRNSADAIVAVVPGGTKIKVGVVSASTVVTAKTTLHPFTLADKGKRFLSLSHPSGSTTPYLPKCRLTNYGLTSPTPVNLTAPTATRALQWCHIVTVSSETSSSLGNYAKATLNVAATASHTAGITVWLITETAAANWIINSTSTPTRTSWAGCIVWMAQQVKTATGVTPAGCELVTEATTLTKWFATSWVKVCNLLKTKFPHMLLGISTGGGATITATNFTPAHFWTKLDYIGKETYAAAGALSPGASPATIQAGWATWCTKAATASAALSNKPIYFTECGYKARYGFGTPTTKTSKTTPVTSTTVTIAATTTTVVHTFETTIPGATILVAKVYTASLTTTYTADFTVTGRTIKRKTASTPAATTFKVKYGYYTEVTQANGLHAMLNACLGQPWFGGFMWWNWGVTHAGSMTPIQGTFTPTRTLTTDTTPPPNVTHNWRQVGVVFRQQLVQRAQFGAIL